VVARSGGFTEWTSRKITLVRTDATKRGKNLLRENTLEFDYDDFVDGEELEKNIA